MDTHSPRAVSTLTSRLPRRPRRESRSWARSLAWFLGLPQVGAVLARSGPLRTRDARTRTAVLAGSIGAAITAVLLLIPGSRAPLAAVIRAPAQVIEVLGGGNTSADVVKGYPRIYSPKLGIDLPIRPGDGGIHPPAIPVAFQYPHTAPLGQPGNTYLYAHDRGGMFLGLHTAHVGDVVIVALSPTEKLYFQITEIHGSVPWNDVEWLRPSNDVRLTLQTCNYSGDFDPRFIVVAKEIPTAEGRALTNGA